MCPFGSAAMRLDLRALRICYSKELHKLLDTNLSPAGCVHSWVCVRDSNWISGERTVATFCLLVSNECAEDVHSAQLIREAVGALLANASGAIAHDLDLVYAFFRGLIRPDSILLPLTYQKQLFGIACLDVTSAARRLLEHCADKLCTDLIYLVRRYQLASLIRQHHRKNLQLIGASDASRELDIFIERASQADLPVLILGENGCESEFIARALHLASRRMHAPFLLYDCLASVCGDQGGFDVALRQAQGGSLFLENVDALPFKGQVMLSELLSRNGTEDTQFRLLASSSGRIYHASERREFYAPLLRHLDFLSTVIAPLRFRPEDISGMCEFFWTKYSETDDMALSEEAAAALRTFYWPGNVEQLERVMAKLVVLRKGAQVEPTDLQRYAPQVLTPFQAGAFPNSLNPRSADNGQEANAKTSSLKTAAWSEITSDLSHCHSAVRKAVDYVIKNYNNHLTLGKVASHACVSPSHLCVLLRRSLGMNFKTLVLSLRVERAKNLFASRPELRVTDISLEVGFSDLGHFEKVFKRFVGCGPSIYRRTLRSLNTTGMLHSTILSTAGFTMSSK